jgi:hypothetical protein
MRWARLKIIPPFAGPETIQFLLGHAAVQPAEYFLGCKQRFRDAVSDRIGLEPGTGDSKIADSSDFHFETSNTDS